MVWGWERIPDAMGPCCLFVRQAGVSVSFVVGSGPSQAPEVPWPLLCPSQQQMRTAVLPASPLHKSPAWSQHLARNHWVIRSPLFHFSQAWSCLLPVHWASPAIMSLLKSGRGSLAPSWEGSLHAAGTCPPGLRKPITFAFHLELRPLPWANDAPIDYQKHMCGRQSLNRQELHLLFV